MQEIYEPITDGKRIKLHDELNFHDKIINVLLKPGHYDMLSKEYPLDFDKELSKVEEEVTTMLMCIIGYCSSSE